MKEIILMNERILKTLEFNKITEQLNSQAATSIGKELASLLKPSADIAEVREMQAETDEASQILRLNMVVPLGGIADIRASVKRSAIGGVLTAEIGRASCRERAEFGWRGDVLK